MRSLGWIVGTLFLETMLIMVAVIGSSKFHTDAPREIIPLTARKGLPVLLGAILLGGIFAKVISTANNYLFSPATNLIHDVYGRFINRNASERQMLIVSRFLVVGARPVRAVAGDAVRIRAEGVALRVYDLRRGGDAGGARRIFLEAGDDLGRDHFDHSGNRGHGRMESRAGAWGFQKDVDAVYPALAASVLSLILVSYANTEAIRRETHPFFE